MNEKKSAILEEIEEALSEDSDSTLDELKKIIIEIQEARDSLKEKEEEEEEKEDDFCSCIDNAIKFTSIAHDLMEAMDVIIDNSAELYAVLLNEKLDDIEAEVKKSGEATITAKFVSGRSYVYKIKMPQPLKDAEIATYKLANL